MTIRKMTVDDLKHRAEDAFRQGIPHDEANDYPEGSGAYNAFRFWYTCTEMDAQDATA